MRRGVGVGLAGCEHSVWFMKGQPAGKEGWAAAGPCGLDYTGYYTDGSPGGAGAGGGGHWITTVVGGGGTNG